MASDSGAVIRPARPDDVAAIEACVTAAYSPFVEAIGRTPAPMLDDYGPLVDLDRVWVATNDDGLVGLIVMWGKAGHWYVDNIAVDPAHQRSGLGSQLLVVAEHEARRAGLREVRLYTNEAMVSNQSFYPLRGYVETHRAVDRGYRRIFYTRPIPAE